MIKIADRGYLGLKEKSLNDSIYCFGAGKVFYQFVRENPDIRICKVIDNYKCETEVNVDGKAFPVISVEQFRREFREDIGVIVTCLKYEEIISQLDAIPAFEGLECYLLVLLNEYTEHYPEYPIPDRKDNAIPKKIHYCWFGRNKLPDKYLEYMETWSKYCPDYQLIRWDEDNYDVTQNGYLRQAYNHEKWAFVSDYARVDVVFQHGGIYLDTDVELVRNFDEFLKWDMFCGFESSGYIAWGLGFGAVRGHAILKSVLERYEQMEIVKSDGSLNLVNCPVIQSSVMSRYGFKLDGTPQVLNNVAVYPKEFFAPYSYYQRFGRITENTHSIHHYAASWMEEKEKQDDYWSSLFSFVKRHQF